MDLSADDVFLSATALAKSLVEKGDNEAGVLDAIDLKHLRDVVLWVARDAEAHASSLPGDRLNDRSMAFTP